MIISLGMPYGTITVVAIFSIMLLLSFGMNMVLNRFIQGDLPDFFTELPAYRIPSLRLLAGKLWLRIVEYFREVLPMIAVGVLIMNILGALHVLTFITDLIRKPVQLLLGLPPDIAPIMLLGFLRKDVSIALLAPLKLSAYQFIIASIFLALYTPCVASFFTLVRETGLLTTLKIVGPVLVAAIGATAVIHLVFLAGGVG